MYLWLPALYGTGAQLPLEEKMPAVRRIWPGLPEDAALPAAAAKWQPEALPLSARQMHSCLNELEGFATDLARGRDNTQAMVMAKIQDDQKAELQRDLADIEALGGGAGQGGPKTVSLEKRQARAQRLLAWFWYQQKNLAEIDALVHKVNKDVLSVGGDLRHDTDEQDDLAAGVIPMLEALAADAAETKENWKLWLEAVLSLVPDNAVFVWEKLPEELEDKSFSAEEDYARALPCPAGLACEGLAISAGELLPPSIYTEAGKTIRMVRLVPAASSSPAQEASR